MENHGVGHSVWELCKKASEKNKQVDRYLKENWELCHNKELRMIIDMLEQKEYIKIINLKPRILIYSNETPLNPIESKIDNNDSLYDQCDLCNQSSNNTIEEKENTKNNSYQLNSQSYRSYRSDSKEEFITANDKLVNISGNKKGPTYEMTKEQFNSWIGNKDDNTKY
jgi:hypothetical protein